MDLNVSPALTRERLSTLNIEWSAVYRVWKAFVAAREMQKERTKLVSPREQIDTNTVSLWHILRRCSKEKES